MEEKDIQSGLHEPAVPAASWVLLAAVSVLGLISAIFVAVTPAGSQTTLANRTFEQFAAQDPEVAALFSMQLVLVGIAFAGFSVLALVLTVVPYRAGERWAWVALWTVPVVFVTVTVRMLSDGYEVGYYYLILSIVTLVGLVIPGRRFMTSAGRS